LIFIKAKLWGNFVSKLELGKEEARDFASKARKRKLLLNAKL